ncbi:hypothetical protein XENTR_v10022565 [Xenopus tropicalis]|nr:hypothetical protein XENTR_v10022565 [Xenopus tropicalis]|eukprot:XP_017952277.1 PREDICTED: coagulation factor XIII B chain-like isoform X1 [Xenopus tropicalis]
MNPIAVIPNQWLPVHFFFGLFLYPERKGCGRPVIQNGRVESLYVVGRLKSIRYLCNGGYIADKKGPKSEYGTAKCTENGYDPKPRCLAPCSLSEEDMDANGIAMALHRVWLTSPIKHGDTASFRCKEGYEISDSKLLDSTCSDGVLTYPNCTKPDGCGPPPEVSHGETVEDPNKFYEHGAAVTYKCQQSYTLEGKKQISCRNGQWDDPPVCKGPCSLSEEEMEANGLRLDYPLWWRSSPVKHENIVSFSCVQRYDISDSSLLRVRCNDGVVMYPKCMKLESCGPPPEVPLGETVQGQLESYGHGSVMTYRCPQYYTLEGKQNVTCRNGTWDEPPACREPCKVTCKDLDEKNITWIWPFPIKRHVLHGEFILFHCLEGYETSKKDLLMVQCQQGRMAIPNCTEQDPHAEGTPHRSDFWQMFKPPM